MWKCTFFWALKGLIIHFGFKVQIERLFLILVKLLHLKTAFCNMLLLLCYSRQTSVLHVFSLFQYSNCSCCATLTMFLYAHAVMCKYVHLSGMRGVWKIAVPEERCLWSLQLSLFVVLIKRQQQPPFLSNSQTHKTVQTGRCKAVKLYPWLDHLNWAPAPPDPTAFKVNWERGPQFPRESTEEEKGGCSCLLASHIARLLAALRE